MAQHLLLISQYHVFINPKLMASITLLLLDFMIILFKLRKITRI